MSKNRLEAFSDGVIAIIITIMVLELRPPAGTDLGALRPLTPVFLSYVLSFVYLAVYWNNHHHLFQAVEHISGGVLWANMHLLFWLSVIPFVTAWMGERNFAMVPMALYGVALLASAVAYTILSRVLLTLHHPDSALATAIARDTKGKISLAMYAAAIPLTFVTPWAAGALFVCVAIMWLAPDPRIERQLPK